MTPPLPPDLPNENQEAAQELGHAMTRLHKQVSSRVMRGMQTELTELDLTFTQKTALHQLRARGAMTVTELSTHTHLSVPATSHLVERLVQRGLTARDENPDNRREKVVSLTPAGLELLSGMDRTFVQAYVQTFAALNPATLRATIATLHALLSELEATSDPPCPQETP